MESLTASRISWLLNWLVRFSLIAGVLIVGGCNTAPPPEPVEVEVEPPPPVMYEHQVRYQGETLGVISRWYTGKSTNWKMIVDANPGMRPERINIGDTILIPQELVVQEEPLPKRAIPKGRGGSAPTTDTAESQPVETVSPSE